MYTKVYYICIIYFMILDIKYQLHLQCMRLVGQLKFVSFQLALYLCHLFICQLDSQSVSWTNGQLDTGAGTIGRTGGWLHLQVVKCFCCSSLSWRFATCNCNCNTLLLLLLLSLVGCCCLFRVAGIVNASTSFRFD